MAINLSAIVQEAVANMVKKGKEQQLQPIISLRDQLVGARDTLAMYHETNETSEKQGKKQLWAARANIIVNAIQSKKSKENLVNTLQKQLISGKTEQDNAAYLQAMKKGYYLLNALGEQVRQDTITYTLVIRSPDNSSAIQWEGISMDDMLGKYDKETGLFGDSNFMTMYAHSYSEWSNEEQGRLGRTLVLKNLWKKANDELNTNNNVTKITGKNFDLLQELDKQKGNRGNAAEALVGINAGEITDKNLTNVMSQIRQNNKPYWQGGDVGTIQVKSNGASFTNVSQLVYRLNQAIQICDKAVTLSSTATDMQKAEQAVRSAEVDVDKIAKDSVEKLLKSMFGSQII